MRDTFYMRAKQNIKNKAAIVVATVIVLGCTGAILGTRQCPGGSKSKNAICVKAPMEEAPVRNDNFCDQKEYSSFKKDKAGRYLLDEKGAKIKNKDYSFADCYKGNGRCDREDKLADLRDPEGNPLDLTLLKTAKGPNGEDQVCFIKKEVGPDGKKELCRSLPLEKAGSPDLNDDSYDCAMEQVMKERCIDEAEPKLKRRMYSKIDAGTPLVQRTRSFMERMLKDPSLTSEANNYFVMPNLYQESCEDPTAELCDPDTPKKCFCGNACGGRPKCKPNGVLDPGEVCDPLIKRGKGSCDKDKICHKCKCVKKPDKCPNGRVDPGEQCDPPKSACTLNGRKGKCNDVCQCEVPPEEKCGNNKVDPGEVCDPPGSACTADGEEGKCSKDCKVCETKPPEINECKSHDTVTTARNNMYGKLRSPVLNIGNIYEPRGDARLTATLVAYFTAKGVFMRYTLTSSCAEGKEGGKCLKDPTPAQKAAAHIVDGMNSLSIFSPGRTCKLTVERRVPKPNN